MSVMEEIRGGDKASTYRLKHQGETGTTKETCPTLQQLWFEYCFLFHGSCLYDAWIDRTEKCDMYIPGNIRGFTSCANKI